MRRGLLLLVAGGFSVALQGSAVGLPWTTTERAARSDGDGFALLEKAARAAHELSYHGTQMVSFWSADGSTSALIDVAHVAGEGLLLRVAPTPQSPGGAVYHDEDGEVPDVVGFTKGTLALLADNYQAGIEGTAEVAGRRADVVEVHRPGASPTARFWIDQATALPLRREVLDDAGRTVRESAFISLLVGDTQVSDTVQEAANGMPNVAGTAVDPADVERLRADGWRVADRLEGGLELFEARLLGTGAERTLQLSYSDGLSTASVFQQRGSLDRSSVETWQRTSVGGGTAWVQAAFPRRVVWGGRGTVYTVVADCPEGTLDALVRAFPHGDPGPGIGTRIGHGLARVGSWFNPFA
jgi:sigma-E factor negative regulatory protein RseB